MNDSYNYNAAGDDIFSEDGIFLRSSDRQRFDYVLRSLRENRLSLALSSDNDGVLDHYGRIVVSSLRQFPGLQVEVFQPKNSEQLLQRLNQILAGISLDDALKFEGSPSAHRVMVAQDAKAMDPRDMELLARLVEDFPGANVSLVLLFGRDGLQVHEKALDSFGQRLLRWPVDAPTREEGEALLAAARSSGEEAEARKLLAATGFIEEAVTLQPVAPFDPLDPEAPFDPNDPIYQNNPFRDDSSAGASHFGDPDQRTEPSLYGDLPDRFGEPPAPTSGSDYDGYTNGGSYPDDTEAQGAARGRMPVWLRWSLAGGLGLVFSLVAIIILVPGMQARVASLPLLKHLVPVPTQETQFAMSTPEAEAPKPATPAPAEQAAPVPPQGTAASSEGLTSSGPVTAAVPTTTAPIATAPRTSSPTAAAPATPAGSAASARPTTPAASPVPSAPVASAPSAPATAAAQTGTSDSVPEKTAPAKTKPATADKPKSAINTESSAAQRPKVSISAESLAADDAKSAKSAQRSERGIDQAIRDAAADSIFVQHASLSSIADAKAWRAKHSVLSKAKIVAVSTQDKGIRYAVISGPFASRKDAEEFAARDGVPSGPWLRPQKLLQAALLPEKR